MLETIQNTANEILKWPAIVQGALGSALFALFMFLGPKGFGWMSEALSKRSKNQRRRVLTLQILKYRSLAENDVAKKAGYMTGLLYSALRSLIRGLIWLVMGLIFDSLVPIFGLIGYLGCLYYLLRAADAVTPIDAKLDAQKKIAELRAEKTALTNK